MTSFSLAPHVGKPHRTVVQSGFGLHVGQHTPLAGSAAIVICVASLQASAMHTAVAHLFGNAGWQDGLKQNKTKQHTKTIA